MAAGRTPPAMSHAAGDSRAGPRGKLRGDLRWFSPEKEAVPLLQFLSVLMGSVFMPNLNAFCSYQSTQVVPNNFLLAF